MLVLPENTGLTSKCWFTGKYWFYWLLLVYTGRYWFYWLLLVLPVNVVFYWGFTGKSWILQVFSSQYWFYYLILVSHVNAAFTGYFWQTGADHVTRRRLTLIRSGGSTRPSVGSVWDGREG